MASRTAHLIAKLTDEVSGPAKGMAGALKGAAEAGKDLGKVGSGSGLAKLTKEMQEARRQAELLTQLQGRMKSFGEARTAFSGARENVERLSKALEQARKTAAQFDGIRSFSRSGGIAQQIEAARKAVRDLERDQRRAQTAVRSAARDMDAEKAAAVRLKRALADLGVPTTTLATAQSTLATRAQAAANALDRQTRAERRAKREGGGATSALAGGVRDAGRPARSLGPLGGAIGAYGVAGAYKQAAQFDRRLTMIGQTADASRTDIDALGGSLHRLAQETATPIDKMAGGLESLVAQGRSLKEGLYFLPSVARTAAASGSEVEDIAKTADSVSTNFGIAGKQMQGAFDIMVAGGKAGQFELKDMARYIPSLAPAASAVGMKAEKGLADVVAMLQVIRKGTGTTEEAATSLTNIFQKMESEETAKKFKKMGVDLEEAMKKGRKEGRNLIEVFEEAAQKATKGDLSKLPNLIADQEFGRGVRALLTYKGEWQKLSETLQTSSAGSVIRDLVQVTKDSQAAVDRLANSWQRFIQGAARAGDSLGASSDLGKLGEEFTTIAIAMERVNKAYQDGGVSGALGEAGGVIAERFRENKKAWLDKDREDQVARIKEMEESIAKTRKSLADKGYSQERIEGSVRSQETQLKMERRALEYIKGNRAALDVPNKLPLRMGTDPTAPIQGSPSAITPGVASWQQAFPSDISGHKPLPSATPLPPTRPGSLPRNIGNIDEVLGPKKIELDATAVDGAQTKFQDLGTKIDEVGQKTIAPTVNTAPVDGLIDKLMKAIGLISQIDSGAGAAAAKVDRLAAAASNAGGAMGRTGKVASALSGSFSSQGMG
ncbi:phage tail tape measure protein [Methylobacterium planeticum]|uniref:Phage tail tape measure protein n=1 Tax=Methylobacterium planeticum TaxID=2615211 RepID=A0A6N6MK79_9HYPH|nr:phage tail tape measure protein [Methylobacterium planeticum]KAB1069270.1 phage tail tape measure protein [Methylobacterium planeticum]